MADQGDELLRLDSHAVMKHLDIYQSIITRMAGNSADCKKWAVALVSAILVLVADKGKVEYAPLAIVPVIIFFFLDTYYLALERYFIEKQQAFVKLLHAGATSEIKLYVIKGPRKLPHTMKGAFLSYSIWSFYLGMLAILGVAKVIHELL